MTHRCAGSLEVPGTRLACGSHATKSCGTVPAEGPMSEGMIWSSHPARRRKYRRLRLYGVTAGVYPSASEGRETRADDRWGHSYLRPRERLVTRDVGGGHTIYTYRLRVQRDRRVAGDRRREAARVEGLTAASASSCLTRRRHLGRTQHHRPGEQAEAGRVPQPVGAAPPSREKRAPQGPGRVRGST